MIRDFQPTDVNQMVKCAQSHCIDAGEGIGTFNKDRLIELIKKLNIKQGFKMFVAERNEEIKGYVVCSAYDNPWNGIREGNINFLYVDPAYRQGFMAKDLLAHAETWFRQMDCKFFNANTRSFNEQFEPNQEFLESGDGFFSRLMTHCGSNYIKEIV